LIAGARVFYAYSEHSVQELVRIAYQYRADLDEDSEAFIEEIYKSGATELRVRQIHRLAGIARLSYALSYDQDVQDVMRLIWAEEEAELPPYVPYKKDAA
jgi:uncharacterized Zn finger protein